MSKKKFQKLDFSEFHREGNTNPSAFSNTASSEEISSSSNFRSGGGYDLASRFGDARPPRTGPYGAGGPRDREPSRMDSFSRDQMGSAAPPSGSSRFGGDRDSGSRFGGDRDSGSRFGGDRDSGSRFGGDRDGGSRYADRSTDRSFSRDDFGSAPPSERPSRFGGDRDSGSRFGGDRDSGSRFGGDRDSGSRFGGSDRPSRYGGGGDRGAPERSFSRDDFGSAPAPAPREDDAQDAAPRAPRFGGDRESGSGSRFGGDRPPRADRAPEREFSRDMMGKPVEPRADAPAAGRYVRPGARAGAGADAAAPAAAAGGPEAWRRPRAPAAEPETSADGFTSVSAGKGKSVAVEKAGGDKVNKEAVQRKAIQNNAFFGLDEEEDDEVAASAAAAPAPAPVATKEEVKPVAAAAPAPKEPEAAPAVAPVAAAAPEPVAAAVPEPAAAAPVAAAARKSTLLLQCMESGSGSVALGQIKKSAGDLLPLTAADAAPLAGVLARSVAAGEFTFEDAQSVGLKTIGDSAARAAKKAGEDEAAARAANVAVFYTALAAALKEYTTIESEENLAKLLGTHKDAITVLTPFFPEGSDVPAAAKAAGLEFLLHAADSDAAEGDATAAGAHDALVKAVAAAGPANTAAVEAVVQKSVASIQAAADKVAYYGKLVDAWAALSGAEGDREVILALSKALVGLKALAPEVLGEWRDSSDNKSAGKMKGLLAVNIWLATIVAKKPLVVQQYEDEEEDEE